MDKSKRFKLVTMITYVGVLATYSAFAGVLNLSSIPSDYILISVLGFFMTGYLPIGFEYAAELTYPIDKQNSAAMVEQLATMSQQRQKIIARNFASQFMKPLFHMVYNLVCENEMQEKMVELSGSYVVCDPRKWKEKRDVQIELHLGYGEQEKEATKYLNMHTLLTNDPNLAAMYQQPNQYELAKKIMELSGVKEVSNYLTNPENIEPPQPDPAAEMQMQMAQKQLELQERQTAIAEMKAQVDSQISQMKIELEKAKVENQHAIQSDSLDLKEEQLRHKKLIDSAELVLAQQADEITAIASPNG